MHSAHVLVHRPIGPCLTLLKLLPLQANHDSSKPIPNVGLTTGDVNSQGYGVLTHSQWIWVATGGPKVTKPTLSIDPYLHVWKRSKHEFCWQPPGWTSFPSNSSEKMWVLTNPLIGRDMAQVTWQVQGRVHGAPWCLGEPPVVCPNRSFWWKVEMKIIDSSFVAFR